MEIFTKFLRKNSLFEVGKKIPVIWLMTGGGYMLVKFRILNLQLCDFQLVASVFSVIEQTRHCREQHRVV